MEQIEVAKSCKFARIPLSITGTLFTDSDTNPLNLLHLKLLSLTAEGFERELELRVLSAHNNIGN
jgi:hypothetical protein